MRKLLRRVLPLVAMFACVFSLAGCSAVKVFEKDVNVVLESEGEYLDSYTVNIFNNAVVGELPEKDGYDFLGWTLKKDYVVGEDSEELLLPDAGLIHYNDVKDAVVGKSATVILYAVFGEKPAYDFVVGWYGKTSTTGLTQTMMDNFATALYAYMTSQGYEPENMLIDIREYASELGVADVGTAVNNAGDVDILIGMGANITSTGGIATLDLESDYTVAGKSRNVARLTDDELTVLIFEWMKTDEVRAIFAE